MPPEPIPIAAVPLPGAEPEGYAAEEFSPEDFEPRPFQPPPRHRVLLVLGLLVVIAALAFLPPLVTVNRYRKQIASSISASLGRPVRIDSVTLTLLPMPGFTLQNFVLGEDPAFGAEPVLQANSVRATLRVSSLWRRHMEFSRISLDNPSVNLVHLPDGRWNLESILLQAARVHAAPTVQRDAGPAPRFPYIEATGARLNFKSGLEKKPLSLTDATLALWQPESDRWRLRLEAHPARTDTAAADSGILRVEGTLGRAASLEQVPLDLTGSWTAAPLGAVSLILVGSDAGVRGEMALSVAVAGTVESNHATTRLELTHLRRADFVPDRPLSADIRCSAQAERNFHRLRQLDCRWPAGDGAGGLQVSAEVPELFHPAGGTYTAVLSDVPLAGLLTGLRAASSRVAPELAASGIVAGKLTCCTPADAPAGTLAATRASLSLPGTPPFLGAVRGAEPTPNLRLLLSGGQATLPPTALELGGATPALLEGKLSATGYQLHLAGPATRARLLALAQALPQFGDGLAEALPTASSADITPAHVDLTGTRAWSGGMRWVSTATPRQAPRTTGRRRRRH